MNAIDNTGKDYWLVTMEAKRLLIDTVNPETGIRESHAPVLGGIMHGSTAVIRTEFRPSSLYDYFLKGEAYSVWDLYQLKVFDIIPGEQMRAYVCVRRRLHTSLKERLGFLDDPKTDDEEDYYTEHEENTLLVTFCVDYIADYTEQL
jgi:hypothetical protein